MRCHFKALVLSTDERSMKEALRQFEFHVRTKNLSPKTISVYGERLGYFARYLRSNAIAFETVTRSTIQDYILWQKERGLADTSINGQIRVLRVFFKFLKEEEHFDTDPTEKIQLLRVERKMKPVLKEEQIQAMLAVPDRRRFVGMRNFVMLLVLYDTLIRLSELINLKLSDVDLEQGTLRIYGKGRKVRIVPIGMKTVKYLHKFFVKHRKGISSDHVFTTNRGTVLDPRNVMRILERIGNKVGVHVSPHLIRHSGASHRAIAGMPAFLLQRLLGHTTIQMTEKYVHLVEDEKLKAAFKQFSPADLMKV
ncbi:MAG: tyrosine-type recombinase/integrase [candidate division Zixibacteria bacterium]|nr:tyrosine-type recombinase/integrase [candidate division Zixibacteria bacterium]